jgi:drug/metabolite transporter (DMT)-like permease
MTNPNLKWVYLIALSMIWGSSFILIKKSLLGLTAYQLGALRSVLTGIILLSFGFYTIKDIPKDKWKWIALSGFIASLVPAFFFAIAETEIDSAVASISKLIWFHLNTILLGLAFFKVTTTTKQVLGVIIGFIGTGVLILSGASINPDQNYLYAGFVIASTLMYATNVNIIKRHLQEVRPLAIAAGNYVFIIIPGLLVLVFTGFFTEATLQKPQFIDSVLYVLVLSVFGTAIAKVLFNKLVQISTPVFASSVTYIMPIVAVLWGWLDGESLSVFQLLGAVLILLGVYTSNKYKP